MAVRKKKRKKGLKKRRVRKQNDFRWDRPVI